MYYVYNVLALVSIKRSHPRKHAFWSRGNQATVDPWVLFEFKPIGLIHEVEENRIYQANSEIDLVVTHWVEYQHLIDWLLKLTKFEI